jgi:hypothetical protein
MSCWHVVKLDDLENTMSGKLVCQDGRIHLDETEILFKRQVTMHQSNICDYCKKKLMSDEIKKYGYEVKSFDPKGYFTFREASRQNT